MPSPKTRLLTPNRWSPKGEALGTRDKMTAVWGGIVGEKVRARITRRGANRDYGEVQQVIEPSRYRTEPVCERVNSCGGCSFMHMNQAGQHRAKQALIRYALREEGLEDSVTIGDVVQGPMTDFRHVIKLVASTGDQGRARLGAPARFTKRVVPIPNCNVVTPELRAFTGHAAHKMLELEVRPYTEEAGGLLRYIVARQSRHTGEILVTVVCTRENGLIRQYCEALAFEGVSGVHMHINTREDNVIFGRDEEGQVLTKLIWGRKALTESLLGVELQVGPGDFFQTNPIIAETLYAHVAELAAATEGVPVVDLYSGVGGFALALAGKSGWAVGVEGNANAVSSARTSARKAGVPAEFVHADVIYALEDLREERLEGRRPVVIVNPARRGLEKGVGKQIIELHPRRVVYVSCNPYALARDVRNFLARGWTVSRLTPFDMFPKTPHVEVVVLLEPPDADEAPTVRAPRRKMVR